MSYPHLPRRRPTAANAMAKRPMSKSDKQEVQYARLDERFIALNNKVDTGFKTITDKLEELNNNFAHRIDTAEVEITKRLLAADFNNFKNDVSMELAAHATDIESLKEYRSTARGFILAVGIVGPIVGSIITAAIIKYANL